jgi:IS30 family transposase
MHAKNKKKRQFKHLTLDDRILIEIRYRDGCSLRKIAQELGNGKTAGSISREIAGKPRKGLGKYQARIAHEKSLAKRIGKRKRMQDKDIETYVKEKLKIGWSPEQISLRLSIDHPKKKISYEAIYQYIYSQVHRGGNGVVKKDCEDLRVYLARRHSRRQKKGLRKARKIERREALPSIENRPKSIEKRKEVGHWEDDCIVSRQSKERLKTVNERATGIVLIAKMRNGSIEHSNQAVEKRLQAIPSEFRKTLTRDRGTENLGYKELESSLDVTCYFAHPYCSYERGSNENLNGLIRRFLPKKTDFSNVSEERLMEIERLINSRPRKRFGGKTPYEVFYEKTGVAIDC